MSLGGDMGTIMDLVLLIIREHPEGISTTDLAQFIPGTNLDAQRAKAYGACKRLEKYEFIEAERIPYRRAGTHANMAVIWRPLD